MSDQEMAARLEQGQHAPHHLLRKKYSQMPKDRPMAAATAINLNACQSIFSLISVAVVRYPG